MSYIEQVKDLLKNLYRFGIQNRHKNISLIFSLVIITIQKISSRRSLAHEGLVFEQVQRD